MPAPTSLLKGFEKSVATAKPAKKRQVIFDPETTGLALIVSPKGKRSFSVVARDPIAGKQVWKRIGSPDLISVAKARELGAAAVARIKVGQSPIETPKEPPQVPKTFREIAEEFIRRWVDKGGKKQDGTPLRSKRDIERQLKTYLYPRWGSKPFLEIRRGVVTKLMDEIVDNHGPVQADRILATLAKMFNWYRQYDEDYVSPIIPEMKRSGSHVARARTRILSDEEIRKLWAGCEGAGVFGAFIRVALLTGQRRAKVATMRWEDLDGDIWTIAAEPREKVNAGKLKLPKFTFGITDVLPRVGENPFVFAGRGKKAFNSFSDGKEDLQTKVKIAPWVIHDLCRTARSLMARAGVRSDIAERTLGHVIVGVEGVYDRHAYFEEKGEALAALAALVERILKGDENNVVQLKRTRAARG
jgi:integrase